MDGSASESDGTSRRRSRSPAPVIKVHGQFFKVVVPADKHIVVVVESNAAGWSQTIRIDVPAPTQSDHADRPSVRPSAAPIIVEDSLPLLEQALHTSGGRTRCLHPHQSSPVFGPASVESADSSATVSPVYNTPFVPASIIDAQSGPTDKPAETPPR